MKTKKFNTHLAVTFIILLLLSLTVEDQNPVVDFIKNNPERSSILLVRNDSILVSHNSVKSFPLASTVKIIVAIEYAEQAANGLIDPNQLVELKDLEKYYIFNTDGGAHFYWLEAIKDKIKDKKVSIREIAKGMIKFSSNANTEWLMDRLGLKNINKQLTQLELKNHSEINYIVSSIFIGKELSNTVKKSKLQKKIKTLDKQEYIAISNQCHEKLKTDSLYKLNLGNFDFEMQKVWSDNLPSASVSDYVSIMKKINNRTYFNQNTQFYLDETLEYILENPENKSWLEHCGMKGGSTAFVLTKAMYARDKKGNKTELAYFFGNLTYSEVNNLQKEMNTFELGILADDVFREKIVKSIKSK